MSAMTAQERSDSRLFPEFACGERIIDRRTSVKRIDDRVGADRTLRQTLVAAGCRSTVVLRGSVSSASSHPTADGEWIFTDYRVQVEAVRKQPHGTAITPNEVVTVARPQGVLIVDGIQVTASTSSFPALTVGGRYWLFVTEVANSRTLKTSTGEGTFVIEKGIVRPVGTDFLIADRDLKRGLPEGEFENLLRASLKDCQNRGVGLSRE